MDAILVGRGTADADDPQLTARPPGPRTATRIVLDHSASLSLDSRLVQTAGQAPVLIAAGPAAEDAACSRLQRAGCEVWRAKSSAAAEQIRELLDELGRRRMTNVLVEGGARVLGAMFDAQLVDEARVFIATKLVGGAAAPSPLAGLGVRVMEQAVSLERPQVTSLAGDVYVRGRLETSAKPSGAPAD
jgi:diaminohydroxyphosphoribosylaminopyrimidine deaminase/5-amino-6-(5-phosphoribosylamino)uracil reductase